MQNSVAIFDTTLRDGAQGNGISFSVDDKLSIVRILDTLGVQYIEAGNPVSNPKDREFFKRLNEVNLKNAKIASFGSTRRKNTKAEEDENLLSLLECDTACTVIFGKCWKLHVESVLETTEDENLKMIEESCAFLKSRNKEVIFDAEHFFDGYKDDKNFAIKALEAAKRGGADMLCLCDTNGASFPNEVTEIVAEVVAQFNMPIAVHFHDDCGMAAANSINGVLAGAVQVQGTMLGFGERCGNANLSTVIPSLQLKMGIECISQNKIKLLTHCVKEIAAIANIDVQDNLPFVGENAFSHKAGMHAHGVIKNPHSFEHIDPYLVGNERKFPTSEISGKAVIFEKIKLLFSDVNINSQEILDILEEIKVLEAKGYQFEGADESFELLVQKKIKPFKPFFELLYYHIYIDFLADEIVNTSESASATIKVKVGDEIRMVAAEGNGPVNALDKALRLALEFFYPVLSNVKLTDYKVRVLESKNATASGVRVLISSSDGINSFTTVGVANDVVAASWVALKDSMEYTLLRTVAEDKRTP